METKVTVLETSRLALRWLTSSDDDAAFILKLVNEPAWLRYIGDKNVRTLADARNYIEKGPLAMCRRLGFGLYLVALKDTGTAIGICGLLKRDALEHVDLGFAFLPAFWGQGYASESAGAVMEHARSAFGLEHLLAVTSPDNESSERLLHKLGFAFAGMTRLTPDAPEVKVFGRKLA